MNIQEAAYHVQPMPGSARLSIVVPVAIISFFYAAVLDYALPLYFSALSAADQAYPADLWSQLSKYQIAPWIIGPIVGGLLARRYGERLIWSAALLGQFFIPLVLAFGPAAPLIPVIALWQGVTSALMWTAGISLVQMVAPAKRGLANGLMMSALGVGSVFGPLGGRLLLYRHELSALVWDGNWSVWAARLASFAPMTTSPQVAEFQIIFMILAASTLFCGLLVGLWGQHQGRFEQEPISDWRRTLHDVGRLARIHRFWLLALTICLLGGLPLQASNQFLPYRAEDLGLTNGAQDTGWIWLQLLRTLMWLPGGVAVGYFAGRRAGGVVAAALIAAAALAALAIGLSGNGGQLFASVAVFEFARQFVRWLETGYLAEHMPGDLRATAIGCALAVAGLGSTLFGWLAAFAWDPITQSTPPFLMAALLGGIGCLGLFLFDRWGPLHLRKLPAHEAVLVVATE